MGLALPNQIQDALGLPSGARFYRCALQVNPYRYLVRQRIATAFASEGDYNKAIVAACSANGIEAIGITDHHSIAGSLGLRETATDAGIAVFLGVEVESREGIHLLCLFDPNTSPERVGRFLGKCGVRGEDHQGTCEQGLGDLLELGKDWDIAMIAAHATQTKGLLQTLRGQARAAAWADSRLQAAAISGSIDEAPDKVRAILRNEDVTYRRVPPVAILNADDINQPDDLARPAGSSWIKMSTVSIEGLRQAFLDAESRIRLATDPVAPDHGEFAAISWQGGFLDGAAIHFNENLNVLIGGRGSGKSSIVESLRYVIGLEPAADEAQKSHDGIIKSVLRSGTRISLLVRSYRPAAKEYLIERTVPNPPVVRDSVGTVLPLEPLDVIPRVEVYGQHEISEIARSAEKRTLLLGRFVSADPPLQKRKADLRRELHRARSRVLELGAESREAEERLASLPALEETLRRFREAGLEDRLREQTLLVREERVITTAQERVARLAEVVAEVHNETDVDTAFVSADALADLPGRNLLSELGTLLEKLGAEAATAVADLERSLQAATDGIASVAARWQVRRQEVLARYEQILRELQRSRVDGEDFIRLQRQIEALRPLRERLAILRRTAQEIQDRRRQLLAEWEEVRAKEHQALAKAAKRVTGQLANRVHVDVAFEGDRTSLAQLLRRQGGRLAEAIDTLVRSDHLSLVELARDIRAGRDALARNFGLPLPQADRLAQGAEELALQVEELDLAATTSIQLNVASEGHPPDWRDLDDLSTGQKATALLLLLLLESDAPLVVDQPEDDLDNRFIADSVVPKMREEKRRRQFLFATHNANIPVLGDAELILGLVPVGEAGAGKSSIPSGRMGSIDVDPVREMVEEILEGGREAFEMRRLKYGF